MQDGAIIGDGRSDFTLKTRSYPFQYNHQNFTLLDVPGIEGSEKKGLPLIGLAFEMWDSWKESQKIEKLEKAKEEMKSNFDGQKQEILALINDETRFKQTCFPSVFELEKCIQECEENVKKTQECARGLEKWIQAGEDFIKGEDFIDVEPEEE